ncbi:Phosphopantothenoylcysteine decarboxylase [Pleurostoma richardsiae]|uniref:Phosphopantothenoylcysteine decarboxylase n=1 Tax=Pleurostoma richardsiae TaxID=41990 RepID=A0AA38S4N3_9PEZI|nr:Phosphopantothenoylcysteine decarboxylase [Pleurostoma richardsiae]
MLQAVGNGHDAHYERSQRNSVAALAAARDDGKVHLLLAASGSVATIKIPEIVKALAKHHGRLSIRIILTKSARQFLAGQSKEQPTVSSLLHLPNVDAVYGDEAEWAEPWRRGAPILHIELRRWADLLAIVPLSANTMAKIVNGLCDGILTSVVRAWDADGAIDGLFRGRPKRILVAPAMNSAMARHPITARQLRVLEEDWGVGRGGEGGDAANGDGGEGRQQQQQGWVEVVRWQDSKALACGDVGIGAMRDWREIVEILEERLGLNE